MWKDAPSRSSTGRAQGHDDRLPGVAQELIQRDAGLRDVKGGMIANSGHFVADEQPDQLLNVLREFLGFTT
jgi:pimeloyl-ACP methyl ester carboxylesterase